MKKVLAFLIAAAMLFGMMPTVFAAETPNATMTASTDSVKPGESVTLTFSIDQQLTNLNNFEYKLYFNSEVFEKTGFTIGNAYATTVVGDMRTDNGGTFLLISGLDMLGDPVTLNAGVVATVTFTAKADLTEVVDAGFAMSFKAPDYDTLVSPTVNTSGDITVSVAPVVTPEEPEVTEGYTVALSPAAQSKAKGEIAQVSIDVSSDDAAVFNAFDMTVVYDPARLTLATTSLGDDHYTIADNNGTVRLRGYGKDVAVGTAFTLDFTVVDLSADTQVTLTSAKVDISANAIAADAPEAAYGNQVAAITLSRYNVTLSEEFIGDDTAKAGGSYTFTAKDKNYDYEFEATMGGNAVTVKDNGDGTYTIGNVSGDLVIGIAGKTPKSFAVTINGEDTTGGDRAAYLTDYIFTVTEDDAYSYDVSVTIGGTAYTGYSKNGSDYTIPGADITGDIVITVTKNALGADEVKVSIDGSGAGDVEGNSSAVKGKDYTFSVSKKDGYEYVIVVMVGGTEVKITDNGDGTYTIPGASITGAITITVTKTRVKPTVEVSQYVKLDGKAIYLVTASLESLGEGKALAYDGNVMSWSDKYGAYAYLVISYTALDTETVSALVTEVAATADSVSYSGDVNGTGLVDINDGQLTYDMYNAKYDSFDKVAMAKFLRADLNGDRTLTVLDSAAVVEKIA